MIQKFVDEYMSKREQVKKVFSEKHPDDYKDVVKATIDTLEDLDSSKIREIDYGEYQGTLLYIIPTDDYQPDEYYFVMVDYGSCSGCDILKGIREYDSETPREDQVKQYMDLSLHIIQGLKEMV